MCELCAQKDRTIAAQEQTIAALTELVNTQRVLPAVGAPPAPASPPVLEGRSHLELLPEQFDEEDARAQLNAGGVDTETAERLLAQLQVVRGPE